MEVLFGKVYSLCMLCHIITQYIELLFLMHDPQYHFQVSASHDGADYEVFRSVDQFISN